MPSAADHAFTESDPFVILHKNIICDLPDVKDLTPEQRFALHEFFHVVLAAGYKLYQVVPPEQAKPIIKKKFGLVIADEDC
jgi:hypothetical protein